LNLQGGKNKGRGSEGRKKVNAGADVEIHEGGRKGSSLAKDSSASKIPFCQLRRGERRPIRIGGGKE